jgi:hypothetical protein
VAATIWNTTTSRAVATFRLISIPLPRACSVTPSRLSSKYLPVLCTIKPSITATTACVRVIDMIRYPDSMNDSSAEVLGPYQKIDERRTHPIVGKADDLNSRVRHRFESPQCANVNRPPVYRIARKVRPLLLLSKSMNLSLSIRRAWENIMSTTTPCD